MCCDAWGRLSEPLPEDDVSCGYPALPPSPPPDPDPDPDPDPCRELPPDTPPDTPPDCESEPPVRVDRAVPSMLPPPDPELELLPVAASDLPPSPEPSPPDEDEEDEEADPWWDGRGTSLSPARKASPCAWCPRPGALAWPPFASWCLPLFPGPCASPLPFLSAFSDDPPDSVLRRVTSVAARSAGDGPLPRPLAPPPPLLLLLPGPTIPEEGGPTVIPAPIVPGPSPDFDLGGSVDAVTLESLAADPVA